MILEYASMARAKIGEWGPAAAEWVHEIETRDRPIIASRPEGRRGGESDDRQVNGGNQGRKLPHALNIKGTP